MKNKKDCATALGIDVRELTRIEKHEHILKIEQFSTLYDFYDPGEGEYLHGREYLSEAAFEVNRHINVWTRYQLEVIEKGYSIDDIKNRFALYPKTLNGLIELFEKYKNTGNLVF